MRHNIKPLLLLILILGINLNAIAQAIPDSVVKQYKSDKDRLRPIYNYLVKIRSEKSFPQKSVQVINFLKSENDLSNIDHIQLSINVDLATTGYYAEALASTLEITARFEKQKDKKNILEAYVQLASVYFYAGDSEKSIFYNKKALVLAKEFNNVGDIITIANNLSTTYAQKKMPDLALIYSRMGLRFAIKSADPESEELLTGTISEAFIANKQYDSALIYLRKYFTYNINRGDLGEAWCQNDMSQVFLETKQYDSAKIYALKAMEISEARGFKDQIQRASEYLSLAYYKTAQPDRAYQYLQRAVAIKDSLYSSDKIKQVKTVMTREQSRLNELERGKLNFENKIKIYSLIAGLLVLGAIAFLLYANNKQKQKTNSKLQVQKEKVENTLEELKITQSQLIQSEKMASLGELTAGIAHEIQNPLNFVNNFSEVSNEMIEEVEVESRKSKDERDDELILETLSDIKQNLDKINFHGKRADAIVKGMLQHSRSSSGKKEPTDINALADEYLRLSYHGLRAKDKSFNATLKTDFDTSIGKIEIIPQDLGRVILNLLTNAFYAVNEKKQLNPENYEPTVSISTKKVGDKVEISVSDNGNGIPQTAIDKIFQPFFTTKPTGQGTGLGLGLSLAYDIVTKGHGGKLKVETNENTGTSFTIALPKS